ncbi:MAG: GNAT family N-acetyltransferase [Thermoplasmata archaeon]
MEILNVEEKDKNEIFEISKNSFEWGDYINEVFDLWLKEGIFIKAVDNNAILGFLHIKVFDKFVWLEGLRVKTEYRKKGIGSELTKKAIELAGNKVIRLLISETNIASLNLAKKFNFNIIDHVYYKEGERLEFNQLIEKLNLKKSNELLLENYMDKWVYYENEYYKDYIYKNDEGVKILNTSPPFILQGKIDFENMNKQSGDECLLILEKKK